MQVGDLVTYRWGCVDKAYNNLMGIVLDIGHNIVGKPWADVHWIVDCDFDNIHFVDDLEVICK